MNAEQQELGIEDEHERQDPGADAVPKGGKAGTKVVATRDRGCRERRQADGWRDVRHQAEVKDKHVHGNQRHDESALRSELDDHRRHQRRHDDIAGGRRHAHAKDEADHRDEEQHADHVAGRDALDQVGHH